ncbi:MAG: hypothetical protein WCW61_02545 [Patescibacteria group bacterium]|jgi:hypothetical protein
MKNRNIKIGFGIPQGGILVGGGVTIVDFEIFMRGGLGSFMNNGKNGHQIDLFKPLDFIRSQPKMKDRGCVFEKKLGLGFTEGWFT